MEFTMKNFELLSQLVFLSGWSIIGVYLARKVGKLCDDVHSLTVSMRENTVTVVHVGEEVKETKENLRDLSHRVIRLERHA